MTPASPVVGALSPGGLAQGTMTLPFGVASGLSIDLFVTFLTIGSNLQWTGLHGATVLRIQT